MANKRPTRREFIQAAGLVAVGSAALSAAGCYPFKDTASSPGAGAAKTRSYRSRPDLAVPIITTTSQVGGAASGLIFVAPGGPMIADDSGDAIWFHPVSGKNVANFRPQIYASNPVLTWWEGKVGKGYGLSGELVIADTTYKELHRIRAGHSYQADLHEFQITSRDTALLTAYTVVPADLSSVGGPAQGTLLDCIVQEIDIASNQVLFEWHSVGHIGLDESHATYTKGQPFDYFHVNSIEVDTDGNLLLSARNTWAIYKINRHSGAVIWRLGGRKSDFTMETGTTFAWQHDARRQADGSITLFDDGAAPKVEPESRGLVLGVNEEFMTVSLTQSYTHGGTGISASSQGSMQVLSNGDAFVGWGSEPYFTEFNSNGDLVLDGKFAGTFQSYRAFRLPWSARPPEKPAVAVVKSNASVTVYASWNGATDVARWEALGGTQASSLRLMGSSARKGFETGIKVTGQPAYVAARALDASGGELGRSEVLGV